MSVEGTQIATTIAQIAGENAVAAARAEKRKKMLAATALDSDAVAAAEVAAPVVKPVKKAKRIPKALNLVPTPRVKQIAVDGQTGRAFSAESVGVRARAFVDSCRARGLVVTKVADRSGQWVVLAKGDAIAAAWFAAELLKGTKLTGNAQKFTIDLGIAATASKAEKAKKGAA